jgi:hypothetical protein
MGVDVMRPAFKLEPKYRVTLLTREEWTKSSGSTPEVKGLVWYTDGSKMKEGTGAGVYGQSEKQGSAFPWVDIQQFSRLRYMLSWPVYMKYKHILAQRNTLVYALIVRRL